MSLLRNTLSSLSTAHELGVTFIDDSLSVRSTSPLRLQVRTGTGTGMAMASARSFGRGEEGWYAAGGGGAGFATVSPAEGIVPGNRSI